MIRVMKKIALIALGIFALALISFFVYFGINIYINEAHYDAVLSEGPWSEPSLWETEDGQAYLLSQDSEELPFPTVTAHFYYDGEWHSFDASPRPRSPLLIFDRTEEDGTTYQHFQAKFRFRRGALIISELDAWDENSDAPAGTTYKFIRSDTPQD